MNLVDLRNTTSEAANLLFLFPPVTSGAISQINWRSGSPQPHDFDAQSSARHPPESLLQKIQPSLQVAINNVENIELCGRQLDVRECRRRLGETVWKINSAEEERKQTGCRGERNKSRSPENTKKAINTTLAV